MASTSPLTKRHYRLRPVPEVVDQLQNPGLTVEQRRRVGKAAEYFTYWLPNRVSQLYDRPPLTCLHVGAFRLPRDHDRRWIGHRATIVQRCTFSGATRVATTDLPSCTRSLPCLASNSKPRCGASFRRERVMVDVVSVRQAVGNVSGLNGRADVEPDRYGLGLGRLVGLVSRVGARNRSGPPCSERTFSLVREVS